MRVYLGYKRLVAGLIALTVIFVAVLCVLCIFAEEENNAVIKLKNALVFENGGLPNSYHHGLEGGVDYKEQGMYSTGDPKDVEYPEGYIYDIESGDVIHVVLGGS